MLRLLCTCAFLVFLSSVNGRSTLRDTRYPVLPSDCVKSCHYVPSDAVVVVENQVSLMLRHQESQQLVKCLCFYAALTEKFSIKVRAGITANLLHRLSASSSACVSLAYEASFALKDPASSGAANTQSTGNVDIGQMNVEAPQAEVQLLATPAALKTDITLSIRPCTPTTPLPPTLRILVHTTPPPTLHPLPPRIPTPLLSLLHPTPPTTRRLPRTLLQNPATPSPTPSPRPTEATDCQLTSDTGVLPANCRRKDIAPLTQTWEIVVVIIFCTVAIACMLPCATWLTRRKGIWCWWCCRERHNRATAVDSLLTVHRAGLENSLHQPPEPGSPFPGKLITYTPRSSLSLSNSHHTSPRHSHLTSPHHSHFSSPRHSHLTSPRNPHCPSDSHHHHHHHDHHRRNSIDSQHSHHSHHSHDHSSLPRSSLDIPSCLPPDHAAHHHRIKNYSYHDVSHDTILETGFLIPLQIERKNQARHHPTPATDASSIPHLDPPSSPRLNLTIRTGRTPPDTPSDAHTPQSQTTTSTGPQNPPAHPPSPPQRLYHSQFAFFHPPATAANTAAELPPTATTPPPTQPNLAPTQDPSAGAQLQQATSGQAFAGPAATGRAAQDPPLQRQSMPLLARARLEAAAGQAPGAPGAQQGPPLQRLSMSALDRARQEGVPLGLVLRNANSVVLRVGEEGWEEAVAAAAVNARQAMERARAAEGEGEEDADGDGDGDGSGSGGRIGADYGSEHSYSGRSQDWDEDEEEEEHNCAICLEDYDEGEVLRMLPCNHHFHQACIDSWLPDHPACPVCRKYMGPDGHEPFDWSQLLTPENFPSFSSTTPSTNPSTAPQGPASRGPQSADAPSSTAPQDSGPGGQQCAPASSNPPPASIPEASTDSASCPSSCDAPASSASTSGAASPSREGPSS